MGSIQSDRYYLDDDWYQDIKLDASNPICTGDDLFSASFHGNNKTSKHVHKNGSQNNGNVIPIPQCLATNKDSDANIDYTLGDDNDNPTSYNPNTSFQNEVICLFLL